MGTVLCQTDEYSVSQFNPLEQVYIMTLLWVMLGSAIGAMARLCVINQVQRRLTSPFPWATLLVNVSGALLIGLLAAALLAGQAPSTNGLAASNTWLLLVVGVLGSYTTVSSFSQQTLLLWQQHQPKLALWNVLASLLLTLAAAAIGFAAATMLLAGIV